MKNLKNKIEELNIAISKVDDQNYKELFSSVSEIIKDLSSKVEEAMVNQTALAENFKYMDQDISGIQEELFEEVSIEDLEELEDQYKEISCSNCGETIFIEESVMQTTTINCPYCNSKIK
jgi:DNA-directed RNA polymerase subunit RPC12/RpoP